MAASQRRLHVSRAHVLAAGTDEVTKLLEDVGLNLQSIMSSRFVRPFSEEVHKWETRLSSVSECLEVWLNVQRKWMYLGA